MSSPHTWRDWARDKIAITSTWDINSGNLEATVFWYLEELSSNHLVRKGVPRTEPMCIQEQIAFINGLRSHSLSILRNFIWKLNGVMVNSTAWFYILLRQVSSSEWDLGAAIELNKTTESWIFQLFKIKEWRHKTYFRIDSTVLCK
jgi:hypothetical protein